jgi:hypothetical protein
MKIPQLDSAFGKWSALTGRTPIVLRWANATTGVPIIRTHYARIVGSTQFLTGPFDLLACAGGGDLITTVDIVKRFADPGFRCCLLGDLRSAGALFLAASETTFLCGHQSSPVDAQMKGRDDTSVSLSDIEAGSRWAHSVGGSSAVSAFLTGVFSTFHPLSYSRLCRVDAYVGTYLRDVLSGRVPDLERTVSVLRGISLPHECPIPNSVLVTEMPFVVESLPVELRGVYEEISHLTAELGIYYEGEHLSWEG